MAKISENIENIKTINELLSEDRATQLAIIQHYLKVTQLFINQLLQDEVSSLTGEKYSRDKPHNGQYSRWGSNPGSVVIGKERVPIKVPRVYDNANGKNVSLESYDHLHRSEPDEKQLLKSILLGLSTSDYGGVVKYFMDGFGLSRSSVSNHFIEASREALKEFAERDLRGRNYLALMIDGKHLAGEQIVIALGISEDGEKIPLGFVQTTTENHLSVKQLLSDIIGRGFTFKDGLLCVIDGSKGLHKAVVEVFGNEAVIQRCQWHKRENVLSYLNKNDAETYKKKLNEAYATEEYYAAKTKLIAISEELKRININAARSLQEGLEETLTIHRLGLKAELGSSFSTTNIIENLNSQLRKYIGRVKYWKTSDQRQRWVAAALMQVEQRMRRVYQNDKLRILQEALKKETKKGT